MTLKSTPVYSQSCSENRHQVGSQYCWVYLLPVFRPCALSHMCTSALCAVTRRKHHLFPLNDMKPIVVFKSCRLNINEQFSICKTRLSCMFKTRVFLPLEQKQFKTTLCLRIQTLSKCSRVSGNNRTRKNSQKSVHLLHITAFTVPRGSRKCNILYYHQLINFND